MLRVIILLQNKLWTHKSRTAWCWRMEWYCSSSQVKTNLLLYHLQNIRTCFIVGFIHGAWICRQTLRFKPSLNLLSLVQRTCFLSNFCVLSHSSLFLVLWKRSGFLCRYTTLQTSLSQISFHSCQRCEFWSCHVDSLPYLRYCSLLLVTMICLSSALVEAFFLLDLDYNFQILFVSSGYSEALCLTPLGIFSVSFYPQWTHFVCKLSKAKELKWIMLWLVFYFLPEAVTIATLHLKLRLPFVNIYSAMVW